MQAFKDDQGRRYQKLRISVTDRCQFRCLYCMPDGPEQGWLPKQDLLSYEEIQQFVHAVAARGIHDVRITGGEPLLRQDLSTLVGLIRDVPDIQKIALTTNGVLLPKLIEPLVAAGLDAVTISIDSLDPDNFATISGGAKLDPVLAGVDALAAATDRVTGKLNAVVIGGQNDHECVELIHFAQQKNLELRFIEYMPFGSPWGWDAVVTQENLLKRLSAEFGELTPVNVPYGSTSRGWRIPKLDNYQFGIIPTMGETICAECDRIRLTADGRMLNCLFDTQGVSIKSALRAGELQRVQQLIAEHLARKGPGYLARQQEHTPKNFVPLSHMHQVGG